ncbi:MAG TPA: tRNA (N6-isopentenyl adenosine(37)-C2)-methylthiotransferase MiaB [Treponema sp.]|nr:MAG: tRNA (N6-isopentenyl adenosine(37)-C2)-methylthiotransferase MiaB [Treponema sp. GWA1_62_8]OHE66950.1 MAG: tRNA (N6-isopentenyl adenosine(37)-C2)-methylthiotransferase MiaB [Treponema sp. GWC1_61_84]HCM25501.1 tRNA (N6-isopentenyl adenosine(37)-C2)-methylthiotransferase MiaB [Treponema sp.]
MTYFFETYGCQMNKAESAALELVLKERGWTAASDGAAADLVLLNTCSVRATAETRVLGRIAHYGALKKNRPFSLAVAGCMAERLKDSLKERAPAVDFVMGTAARSRFPLMLEALETGASMIETDEEPVFSFSSSHLEEGEFRSFVPIMHGCDNFCSYCIVPYVRGREISRSPASILEEIALLESRGVREITLLGQNVNSYRWADGAGVVDFPALLRLVAGVVRGIRWVRFLSSHPKDLSPAVIDAMRDHEVLRRHIHLCVQHGSDRILAAMNRRYTRERYLALAADIRSALPDVSLSTDILVGFPGETEEDVQATLGLMEEVRFSYAYMYHYNPREGTAAYALPGRIEDSVKKERLARVIDLQQEHTRIAMRARVGLRTTVLVEGFSRKNRAELVARTDKDEMVVFPGPASLIGSFADVTISSLRGKTFRAKEAEPCPGV